MVSETYHCLYLWRYFQRHYIMKIGLKKASITATIQTFNMLLRTLHLQKIWIYSSSWALGLCLWCLCVSFNYFCYCITFRFALRETESHTTEFCHHSILSLCGLRKKMVPKHGLKLLRWKLLKQWAKQKLSTFNIFLPVICDSADKHNLHMKFVEEQDEAFNSSRMESDLITLGNSHFVK